MGVKHYVYYIQAGKRGPIKIGVARNVESRLDNLQTGNHEELRIISKVVCESMEAAYHMEKILHMNYKKHHIRGEWFKAKIVGEIHRREKDKQKRLRNNRYVPVQEKMPDEVYLMDLHMKDILGT